MSPPIQVDAVRLLVLALQIASMWQRVRRARQTATLQTLRSRKVGLVPVVGLQLQYQRISHAIGTPARGVAIH